MPPSQSLIYIYLMCSFCSFTITSWFGELPNNISIFLTKKEKETHQKLEKDHIPYGWAASYCCCCGAEAGARGGGWCSIANS